MEKKVTEVDKLYDENVKLIDSHCHMPHRKYEKPLEEIIEEAKTSGVSYFIDIGTDITENNRVIKVAQTFPEVFASVAIYPQENRNKSLDVLEKHLRKVVQNKKVVAIGECGIDTSSGWQGGRPLNQQLELFEMQLNLATELKMPVIIHNRNGDEQILNMLNKYVPQGLQGVIHCFTSDWDFAQKVLDLGFYISFTGMITYPKKGNLLEVVKNVPDDRFLVETDAPYLPPQEHRGEVNYPRYVTIVAREIAQVKQKPFEEIARNSYRNTIKLFSRMELA